MRKALCLMITVVFLAGCGHSPKGMLAWRWDFEAVDLPGAPAFIDSLKESYDEDDKATMHRFLLDYKLILRKDNTFDLVLFKKYLHGAWVYDEQSKTLSLSDSMVSKSPLMMRVDSISPIFLALRMDSAVLNKLIPPYQQDATGFSFFRQKGKFTFFFAADKDTYGSEKSDPYSRQNNLWRIKPLKPETDKELIDRVKNHLQFCKVYFEDILNRQKNYVSLHSFRTPLVISKNQVTLRNYANIRDAWDESFYDTTQAQKGYIILRDCMKDLPLGGGNDRLSGDIDLLGQMIEKLEK